MKGRRRTRISWEKREDGVCMRALDAAGDSRNRATNVHFARLHLKQHVADAVDNETKERGGNEGEGCTGRKV